MTTPPSTSSAFLQTALGNSRPQKPRPQCAIGDNEGPGKNAKNARGKKIKTSRRKSKAHNGPSGFRKTDDGSNEAVQGRTRTKIEKKKRWEGGSWAEVMMGRSQQVHGRIKRPTISKKRPPRRSRGRGGRQLESRRTGPKGKDLKEGPCHALNKE